MRQAKLSMLSKLSPFISELEYLTYILRYARGDLCFVMTYRIDKMRTCVLAYHMQDVVTVTLLLQTIVLVNNEITNRELNFG